MFFDGHNDALLKIKKVDEFFTNNEENSHMDLNRIKKSGFGAGFFAMFSPGEEELDIFNEPIKGTGYTFPLSKPLSIEESQQITNQLFARILKIEKKSLGEFKIVRTSQEIEDSLREKKIAAILHMEGAESIDSELNALHLYYEAGLRSLGLVWSRENIFGTGVPYHFPASPDIGDGLTAAGKELVKECNKLGIMLDLSHLNEKGFWDVARLSDAPLVATHSNAHTICPIARNLTDEQLDVIGQSGGVVGVTYCVNMVREDGRIDVHTDVQEIIRHIQYIGSRIGYDHVALGSDFDGALVPKQLKDVTGVPVLLRLLKKSGLSQEEVEKVAYRNWLRTVKETWK